MPVNAIKVFCIGPDETEYYAANSKEELRQYYIQLVGAQQAEEDFANFREIPKSELDVEFEFNDDGVKRRTTWRKEIAGAKVPCQISTGYN